MKPSVTAFLLAAIALAIQSAGAKKILIAFDGSGNNARDFMPNKETNKAPTNILRLHLLAGGSIDNERNDIPGQISLYRRGVGGVSTNPIIALGNQMLGILKTQINPMRKMLEEVYEEGDSLYIIGYSRGAASARKLATELDKKGLKTKTGKKVAKPNIQFVGCFETVAMQVSRHLAQIDWTRITGGLTFGDRIGEKGGKMPDIVQTYVHNVALDDNRFRFGTATDKLLPPQPNPPVFMDSANPKVHEVFFPGQHGDIGGYYYEKGLSDASLKFMKEFMEKEGLQFISNEAINDESLVVKVKGKPDMQIKQSDLAIVPDASQPIHQNKWQRKLPSRRPVITVTNNKAIKGGTVKIHESVLAHMKQMEAAGTPYKYNPKLKEANVVVVGSLGKTLDAETEALKKLLKQ